MIGMSINEKNYQGFGEQVTLITQMDQVVSMMTLLVTITRMDQYSPLVRVLKIKTKYACMIMINTFPLVKI